VASNIHRSFVADRSTAWISFIFYPRKIRISTTNVVSSLSPPRCRLSSSRHRHAAVSCHASLLWSQDKLTASALSNGSALSYHLPSRAEIETLNLHHRHQSPSSDCSTLTLHYYKKVISILVILPNIQLRLYFASSLVRAPYH
jgi:hypothetical protein